MSVLGIVAEYDPFHSGHLHHLRAAVSAVSPSAVLVGLSGPFRQRGVPSLLSPFSRAQCALAAGADAVFALPVLWTVRDAEHYALGAVSLIASLGATHLAFGAETADLDLLRKTADLLEDAPASLRNELHASLSEGAGYPASLARAAEICLPESGVLLRSPNNILAVCYLRAIRRLSLSLTPVVIPRTGGYSADRIDPEAPSASAVTAALRRGDWQNALSALPPASAEILRADFLSGNVPDLKQLDILLLEKLRSMAREEAALLPDCPEGLDAALLRAAARVNSREELIAALTGRRYPSARISRLCTYALLGITKESVDTAPLPDRALLLALKKNPSMTGSWKNGPVRVSAPSKGLEGADPAERAAWRVWALCCGKPASWPFEQKLVTGD